MAIDPCTPPLTAFGRRLVRLTCAAILALSAGGCISVVKYQPVFTPAAVSPPAIAVVPASGGAPVQPAPPLRVRASAPLPVLAMMRDGCRPDAAA